MASNPRPRMSVPPGCTSREVVFGPVCQYAWGMPLLKFNCPLPPPPFGTPTMGVDNWRGGGTIRRSKSKRRDGAKNNIQSAVAQGCPAPIPHICPPLECANWSLRPDQPDLAKTAINLNFPFTFFGQEHLTKPTITESTAKAQNHNNGPILSLSPPLCPN